MFVQNTFSAWQGQSSGESKMALNGDAYKPMQREAYLNFVDEMEIIQSFHENEATNKHCAQIDNVSKVAAEFFKCNGSMFYAIHSCLHQSGKTL